MLFLIPGLLHFLSLAKDCQSGGLPRKRRRVSTHACEPAPSVWGAALPVGLAGMLCGQSNSEGFASQHTELQPLCGLPAAESRVSHKRHNKIIFISFFFYLIIWVHTKVWGWWNTLFSYFQFLIFKTVNQSYFFRGKTDHVNHFWVRKSVALRTTTVCDRGHCPSPDLLIAPNWNFVSLTDTSPFPSARSPW